MNNEKNVKSKRTNLAESVRFKKTTSLKKTTVIKKRATKSKAKRKNNAFTLIELLAVIIILGVLMIIAIPSVTRYISDSRKSAYVDTAKQIIGSARNLVNSGDLGMYSTDTTYYIDQACIKTENKASSPYGEFVEDAAYVVVTYDGNGYTYYWTSIDVAGQGISKITRMDKLDPDLIESDLKTSDIKNSLGIDGRTRYMVINKSTNCKSTADMEVSGFINAETGEEINPVEYPSGKTKSTVIKGDLVKIGNEEFYVVSNDGTNLVLLAHYNLKVGSIYNYNQQKIGEYTSSDLGYGLQSSETLKCVSSDNTYNGIIAFSNSYYWADKVGNGLTYPGKYCESKTDTNCAYIYDSNSILYSYIQNYKTYLEKSGVHIKEARLLSLEEAYIFNQGQSSKLNETYFWLGTATNQWHIWKMHSYLDSGTTLPISEIYFGIRPVVVI